MCKYLATFLLIFIAASGSMSQENREIKLYITRLSHVSLADFDDLSEEPYEIPNIASSEANTVTGVELTQDLCVLNIERVSLEFISHSYNNSESGLRFNDENIIAKVSVDGKTQFIISSNQEIADESLFSKKMSDVEFARLTGYLFALVDTSKCQ